MARKIFLALFLSFVLYGQVWSVDADSTMRPVGDRGQTDWIASSGERWECFDDITPDEDVTYVYDSTDGHAEMWYADSFKVTDNIDSVTLTVRGRSLFDTDSAELVIGRVGYTEVWVWCNNDVGTDTIKLTSSYTDYSITWANDPCGGASWTMAKLNATDAAWAFMLKEAGTVAGVDTVLEDNFNDNSLDGDKWVERHVGGSSQATEQNEQMELVLDHSAHCGAGIYTKDPYSRSAEYILKVDFQTNWDYDRSTTNYGYDGIWILRGDTSGTNFWDEYYGSPTTGVFLRLSSGCGEDDDGIGIYYDDDLGFECGWDTTVAENSGNCIDTSSVSWYDVRIYFDGSSGLCSLIVGDSIVTGTLGSNWLSDLGSTIRFQLHQSYYDTDVKLDKYDNFYLIQTDALFDAENRVTQSFIEVFYQEAAEEASQVIIVH